MPLLWLVPPGTRTCRRPLAEFSHARRLASGFSQYRRFVAMPFLPAPTVGITRTACWPILSRPRASWAFEGPGHEGFVEAVDPSAGPLVSFDLSQAEPWFLPGVVGLRCAEGSARLWGDLYQALADDLGVARPVAKQLVLAVTYGEGAYSVGLQLGVDTKSAAALQDGLLQAWPGVRALRERVQAERVRSRAVGWLRAPGAAAARSGVGRVPGLPR